MRNFFLFLKSKQFFLQIFIIVSIILIAFFVTLQWLSSYTNHGKSVKVPDFKGQKLVDLDAFIQDKDVTYEIIDSIYDPKQKPGIVLRQDPEMNVAVKHNRKVYLYVTGMVAPPIKMPKLVDRSERQARLIINSYGLKVGTITEQAADCNGCVISQLINGKEVEPGADVKKGSVIGLVVGKKDNYYHSSGSDSASVQDEPNFDD